MVFVGVLECEAVFCYENIESFKAIVVIYIRNMCNAFILPVRVILETIFDKVSIVMASNILEGGDVDL